MSMYFETVDQYLIGTGIEIKLEVQTDIGI